MSLGQFLAHFSYVVSKTRGIRPCKFSVNPQKETCLLKHVSKTRGIRPCQYSVNPQKEMRLLKHVSKARGIRPTSCLVIFLDYSKGLKYASLCPLQTSDQPNKSWGMPTVTYMEHDIKECLISLLDLSFKLLSSN